MILIADVCGLCYGSKRAIDNVLKVIKEKDNVVLYKEILHNKNVVKMLEDNQVIIKNNINEINNNDYVIIRAHGEPYSTFKYFDRNKIEYLDCTCPNVKAIQLLANKKSRDGYKIIIIGKVNHPETIGINGWCDCAFIVENEEQINNIDLSFLKYFLVVQTTFSKDKAINLIKKIDYLMKLNNKIFEYKNTTCNAQKNINDSAIYLANKVDVMIVMGGKNSSNSKELFNNISKIKETYFIENLEEVSLLIKNNKIRKEQKIGITAGASTLKEDILQLEEYINNLIK